MAPFKYREAAALVFLVLEIHFTDPLEDAFRTYVNFVIFKHIGYASCFFCISYSVVAMKI